VDNLWHSQQWVPDWSPKHAKTLVRLAKEPFNAIATASRQKKIEGILVREAKYQAGSTPWTQLIGSCCISIIK
jgi:hypothetical protein